MRVSLAVPLFHKLDRQLLSEADQSTDSEPYSVLTWRQRSRFLSTGESARAGLEDRDGCPPRQRSARPPHRGGTRAWHAALHAAREAI